MENGSEGSPPQPAVAAPQRKLGRRRLLFIGVTLAVFFVAQEALFRYLFPVPEVLFNRAEYMPRLFSTEISSTRNKALCNVIIRWECAPDGMAFDHTLNLYGFRGPDFAIEPPADRPRIVFVGDSYVEGCGASDDDTLPRQFAGLVNDGPAPEVLNLGVAAANFPEYLQLIRDSVPLLRPHTLFLVACWNDLPAPASANILPPSGGLEALGQRPFPRLNPYQPRVVEAVSLLCRGWVLPRRWHAGVFPFFAAVPSPSNRWSRNPYNTDPHIEGLDPEVEQAMRAGKANPHMGGTLPLFEQRLRRDYEDEGGVANLLRFLAWFCHEHGVRLHLVYIPYHVAANPAYREAAARFGGCVGVALPASFSDEAHRTQQRHLAKACRDAGVTFLDTTDAFIAAERQRRLFWPTDGHCNAAGYRLIAEACARCWAKAVKP